MTTHPDKKDDNAMNPTETRFHWIQCSNESPLGYTAGMEANDVNTVGVSTGGDDADGQWANIATVSGGLTKGSIDGNLYHTSHNPKIEVVWRLPSSFDASDILYFGFHKVTGLAPPRLGIYYPGSGNMKLYAQNSPYGTPGEVWSTAHFGAPVAGGIYRMMVRWDDSAKKLIASVNGSAEAELDLSSWNGVVAEYGWACGISLPDPSVVKMAKFGSFMGRWQAYPGGAV